MSVKTERPAACDGTVPPPECCQPAPLCPACRSWRVMLTLLPSVLGQGVWECWDCLATFRGEPIAAVELGQED